ncbi:MAG TPA: MFS transporter [Xanthobacteraceae bacterium]|nr:MFS transporter [Xanthobacteraceae bacterium]
MTDDISARTLRKIERRLIYFCMLLFILNYVDRLNVGFAALQMNKDLGFGPTVYGIGAGIFFFGYFVFEIPSNLILERVGARVWLARIAITWGIISAAMAFVQGATSFYVVRFLLGFAEAGLLPGIMLYFSYWFPMRERAKALALFMTATAISNIVGAPLSSWLIGFDGIFGLRGWQLMFVIEGIPSVLIGIAALFYLVDRPEQAAWLADDEKAWLQRELAAETAAKEQASGRMTLRMGLTNPRVLLITLLCFFLVSGNFGVVFWMPQIIKALGDLSIMQVGALTMIPYAAAVVAMVWWGRRSDRTGDRKWHLAIAAVVGAAGLAVSALPGNPVLSFVALCVAAAGIWSMFGVFWAVPADFLSGTAAAGGFALINSFGTLGGFLGPFLVGFVRQHTGSFTGSLLVLAGFTLMAAVISAMLPPKLVR